MRNSVKILKYIKGVIEENIDVPELFESGALKFYPIDAQEGTKMPFLVAQRTNILPEYSKDGSCTDNVYVTVMVVTDSYNEGVDIADKVRDCLESKRGVFDDGFCIRDMRCTGFSENIYRDAFIQGIDFKITI